MRTVDRRCAMTKVVRSLVSAFKARWMRASVALSSALVASSRIRIGASLSIARAIDRRWRSPPDSERAAFGDQGRIAVGFDDDEVMRLGSLRGGFEFRVARFGLADAQVVGDRAVEQARILEHHGDVLAQRMQTDLADVDAIDADAPCARIVGAIEQAQRRGLARAGRADQRHRAAGRDAETQVPQCRMRSARSRTKRCRIPRRRAPPPATTARRVFRAALPWYRAPRRNRTSEWVWKNRPEMKPANCSSWPISIIANPTKLTMPPTLTSPLPLS